MTFKRLYKKADDDTVLIKRVELPAGVEQAIYTGQEVLEDISPKIYLKHTRGYLPDFLTGGTSILVVSSKVKRFLENSSQSEALKFFAVQVFPRSVKEEFFMLNIIGAISCFDRKRSVFEVPPENPDAVVQLQKMVIDESKVGGRKLFYMKEQPVEVFIDESFADEMAEAGIRDMRLLPLVGCG